MNTEKSGGVMGGSAVSRVDWSAMSDAQLNYQADCFERQDEEMPVELWQEFRRRNLRNEIEAERLAEANFGA